MSASLSLAMSLAPSDCRDCNATTTRAVRWTLTRYVRSVVAMTGVSLQQESCPLSALLAAPIGSEPSDCFSSQDNRSLRTLQGRLRCLVCGKVFRSQLYLDRHFSNRHADVLPKRAPCLDSLCDVLHCEAHEPGTILAPVGAACVPTEANQRQTACKRLFESCFGADSATSAPTLSSDVRDVLVAEFCSVHSCSLDAVWHSRGEIVGALALEWHRGKGVTAGASLSDGVALLDSILAEQVVLPGSRGHLVRTARWVWQSALSETAFIAYVAVFCLWNVGLQVMRRTPPAPTRGRVLLWQIAVALFFVGLLFLRVSEAMFEF